MSSTCTTAICDDHTYTYIHTQTAKRRSVCFLFILIGAPQEVYLAVDKLLLILLLSQFVIEERGNETGQVAIAHGSVEFCEATPIGLADES